MLRVSGVTSYRLEVGFLMLTSNHHSVTNLDPPMGGTYALLRDSLLNPWFLSYNTRVDKEYTPYKGPVTNIGGAPANIGTSGESSKGNARCKPVSIRVFPSTYLLATVVDRWKDPGKLSV
jgi:hypothetical protein